MRKLAPVALAIALVAVACSDKIDRDGSADVIARDLGVSQDVARCIVDESIDAVGEGRLIEIEEGAEPTEAEAGAIFNALVTCDTE